MKRLVVAFAAVALAMSPGITLGQHQGGGGQHQGGGGCGDVFGDLIHILRDGATGQPILARRYVELPKEVPGYGWGYCTIALTEDGAQIPFLPYSCDLNLDPDGDGVEELEPVEVNYFGRLSGGRTKEKNHRMHFDEVIETIKMAGQVKQESATGRLMMGFDCAPNGGGQILCEEWSVVDSPMESMALYTRSMKYGHLQTDPEEFDIWWMGDPAQVPPFHPTLTPSDWAKFDNSVRHLLPGGGDPLACFTDDYPEGGNGVYDAPEPYVDENENGFYEPGEPFKDVNGNSVRDPGDTFNPACAAAEYLTDRDFIRAGSFLGAAANKTGKITVDLTQYMNRILKITLDTNTTVATAATLPALILDCEDPAVTYEPPDESDPDPQDPPYLPFEEGAIYDAHPGLENYDVFPDVQELFVDFSALTGDPYVRDDWRSESFEELILPVQQEDVTDWVLSADVTVMGWLVISNGPGLALGGVDGFVLAASDALRSIEFVHNYEVPEYLPYE